MIEDFYSIGEDGRHDSGLQAIEEASQHTLESGYQGIEDTSTRSLAASGTAKVPPREGDDTENQDQAAAPTSPSSQQLREAMKRKWDTALDEIDTNDTYRLSKYRKLEEARAREAKEAAAASAKALLIRYQSLPTTPLVALTGPNKQRNTRHDILALIVSISPELIKRTGMPPKRDLRVMDISTIKKVSLSVFANAEDFHPEPGTAALFKHLTTHDYDGGSLNAYAKDCEGQDWFIPDPPGFENGEVAQLKDCWARLQFSEQVAREQSDSLSQLNEPLDIPEEEDIADRLPTVSGKKHLTCFYWAKNGCRYTDDECAYAHYNTGIVAHDPMHNQSISTANNTTTKQAEPSGLPPSRSLTCFFWARNRKCSRSDEECSYAHYDTGNIARAPPGITVFEPTEESKPPLTKTLTCYFWNRNGKCSRSDEECAYAHHHTGTVAYPPPNVVASLSSAPNTASRNDSEARPAPSAPASSSAAAAAGGKSLTCFFWARNGHCNRSDTQCAYAHYDTGTVAHNPNPALYPEPLPRLTLQVTPAAQASSPKPTVIPSSTAVPTATSASAVSAASITATIAPAPAAVSPFPPVKHLTCYFWANFGRCKRSDQECNYAHFHTGKMAANPAELRRRSRP